MELRPRRSRVGERGQRSRRWRPPSCSVAGSQRGRDLDTDPRRRPTGSSRWSSCEP